MGEIGLLGDFRLHRVLGALALLVAFHHFIGDRAGQRNPDDDDGKRRKRRRGALPDLAGKDRHQRLVGQDGEGGRVVVLEG